MITLKLLHPQEAINATECRLNGRPWYVAPPAARKAR